MFEDRISLHKKYKVFNLNLSRVVLNKVIIVNILALIYSQVKFLLLRLSKKLGQSTPSDAVLTRLQKLMIFSRLLLNRGQFEF